LPELAIDVTPTFVISTAIATRDFQDVHHDRDKAVARGGKDIFINILTTTGLVQRYVTDWAGSDALVRKVDIRLGVPCYAGAALADAGLDPADVDGLVTFTMDSTAEIALARELGLGDLRFFSHVGYGGGAACGCVPQAVLAITAGIADVVVCYRALNERSGHRFGQVSLAAVRAAT